MQHSRFRPTESGRVSGCRVAPGGRGKKHSFSFGLRKQLHSSPLWRRDRSRAQPAARWLRGRLDGPKRPSKRGSGRGRRWSRHQLLLLAEGRVRVSPAEAEGANSDPGAVAARAEPRPVPPAFPEQRLPAGRSVSPSCRSSSFSPPFPGAGRERLVGLAHSGGGGGCRWVRRIPFLRERWRLAKSVPSLGTRQEREATLLTEFNRCGEETAGGEKLSGEWL